MSDSQEYVTPEPRTFRIGGPPRLEDGSGFVLGVFLWALTLAYINPRGQHRSGIDGVKDWLRAKFLNKGPDGQFL